MPPSGLCGRLMCCLKYENDEYEAAKKELPDYGKEVITPKRPHNPEILTGFKDNP
jgi:cell fate regulator YaaT (PSP1 superfamily)